LKALDLRKNNYLNLLFFYMNIKPLLFCLFFVQLIFGQKLFIDNVVTPLQENQLTFEKVFIHANKSMYTPSDIIWFKAYVALNNNTPSLKTTLLYVNLLSDSGDLISSRSILIKNGTGHGQFELGSGLKPGTYFIQAYTNYMKNFGKENYFLQEIKCEGTPSRKATSSIAKYDIQLFPEGGHLLSGVINNLAIKALINSKGAEFSGEIIDRKNKVITTFKNSYLGMTKSSFLYKKGGNYIAKIHLNDTIINIAVPKAKNSGISLRVDNSQKSTVRILLQSTDYNINNKYVLLIHQRNKLLRFYTVERKYSMIDPILVTKKALLNGVHTITVFENNMPIAERKFFVEKENKKSIVAIHKQTEDLDSITYKLNISTPSLTPVKAKISVSILQAPKKSYKQATDIKSAFLLSPYTKGYIERPSYYFDKNNPKRMAHLDLLLLTQGWSQYSLNKMISELNPIRKHNFELGFKITGRVSPILTNHLGLISNKNKLIDTVFLTNKNEFTFKKLLFHKGDTLKFTFIDKDNTAFRPVKIDLDIVKPFTFPSIGLFTKNTPFQNNTTKTSIFYAPHSIKLNEIEIKGKKLNRTETYRKKIWDKHRSNLPITFLEITNKKKEKQLKYYLNNKERIRLITVGKKWVRALTYNKKRAHLFVDERYIYSFELEQFLSITANNIETIVIQETRNGNKIAHVYTTENYKKGISDLFEKYLAKNGYDKTKKYYAPIFDFENSHLSEIDWKPNLESDKNGALFFKTLNKKTHSIIFSIQGFSTNGILISELKSH